MEHSINSIAKPSKRVSNIELLRIVSILMIVLSHFSFHGFFSEELRYNWIDNIVNKLFLQTIQFGSLGVDIFVLITGYYLINNTCIRVSKIVKLVSQVLFYTLSILIILALLGKPIGLNMIIDSLLPISGSLYWFVTCYVILYIFHPYLNLVVSSFKGETEKNKYKVLVLLMLCLFSFYHTFLYREMFANELVQFIFLYYIGGYLRRYPIKVKKWVLVSLCLIWLLIPIIGHLTGREGIINHITFFYTRMSLLSILLSVSIFSVVAQAKPFYSRFINTAASSVLAVYLIHDNPYFRDVLYIDMFNLKELANSNYLPLYIFVFALMVLGGAVFIDLIRQQIFAIIGRLGEHLPQRLRYIINYEYETK